MSMREIDRLKTVQAVMDGTLRVGLAARRLELSRRQLERLLRRYQAQGAAGLLSRRRGRPRACYALWPCTGGSGPILAE